MIVCGTWANSEEDVCELIKMGCDPTLRDNEGWTALHWAAFHDSKYVSIGNCAVIIWKGALTLILPSTGLLCAEC